MAEEEQPIIIIKKKGGHGGHHGGAWKVAYADFVTAMMAFFLVMWLVSQDAIVKENVAGYFNDPSGWGRKEGGASVLKGSPSVLKGASSIMDNKGVSPMNKNMTEARAREVLKEAGEKIYGSLEGLPNFDELKDHISIEMTEEGLRIELIEAVTANSDSAYFFDKGSAEISPTGETIISTIGKELGKLPNKVVIEGHTDSQTYVYKSRYSNWELSADRANSARKLLESNGLKDSQIAEIRGYAANRPKIKDNPRDARNRRISILVLTDAGQAPVEHMEMHEMIDGKVIKDIN
jgi:chemotaxis protein MotB